MKNVIKFVIVLLFILGFYGLIEIINIIPIYKNITINDLHGIDRLFYVIQNIVIVIIGYLYGIYSYIYGKKLFYKLNK